MTSCSFSMRTFPSQVATTLDLHIGLLQNVVLSKSFMRQNFFYRIAFCTNLRLFFVMIHLNPIFEIYFSFYCFFI